MQQQNREKKGKQGREKECLQVEKVRGEMLQKTWRKNSGEKRMRMDGDV